MRLLSIVGLVVLSGCGGTDPPVPIITKSEVVPTSAKEKTWYGKNAGQWLDALKGKDDHDRSDAARYLPEVGPEIIPAIVQCLKDPNPKVVAYANITLVRIGPPALNEVLKSLEDDQLAPPALEVVVKIIRLNPAEMPRLAERLMDENPKIRGQLARILGQLGPEAGGSLPALLALFKDPDSEVRVQAAEAVQKIGVHPSMTPELVDGLADTEPQVRAAVALALARLKTTPGEAVPPLIKMLQQDDAEGTRAAAATALGKVAGTTEIAKAVGALRKALGDKSAVVRSRSASALGTLAAVAAVPDLIGRLKDEDGRVRQSAAGALGELGSEGQPAVGPLAALLQDMDADLRQAVVLALAKLGRARVPGAAAGLATALRDRDRQVQQSALAALGKIGGPQAAAAISVVVEIVNDGKHDLAARRQALDYIALLGEAGKPAVPALAKILKDPDSLLRLEAATTLAKIGAPAVPALTEALKDSELQSMAAHALAQVGPAAKSAVPALMQLVQNPKVSSDARANAAIALAQVSPAAAAPAAPALAEAVKDPAVRTQALDALIKIGEPAMAPLFQLLEQKNSTLRQDVFKALRQIGKPTVPGLVKLLQDKSNVKELREGAIKSLAAIGPNAKDAVPALKEAVNDPDGDISKAAAAALKSIE